MLAHCVHAGAKEKERVVGENANYWRDVIWQLVRRPVLQEPAGDERAEQLAPGPPRLTIAFDHAKWRSLTFCPSPHLQTREQRHAAREHTTGDQANRPAGIPLAAAAGEAGKLSGATDRGKI